MHATQCRRVLAQGFTRMGSRMLPHIIRCAKRHHFAARLTPFGPEVDQPVTGTNHIQVVLDHDQ